MTSATYCAIDFGTSNSAVAVPDGATMRLVELEPGFRTMPTAVFYPAEGVRRGPGGRAAQRGGKRGLSRGRVPVRADRRRLRPRADGDARREGPRRGHRRRHVGLLARSRRP